MLEDFANSQNEPSFAFCFNLVFLELSLVKSVQFREYKRGKFVDLFINHLVAVFPKPSGMDPTSFDHVLDLSTLWTRDPIQYRRQCWNVAT